MKTKRMSPFLKIEMGIVADDLGGVVRRWKYGREALKHKVGRKKLPDGMLDSLIKEAADAGIKISRQEIQRRMRCAEVYEHDRQLRRAVDAIGSWSELVAAGFPFIESDEPDDLDSAGISAAAPDDYEQLSLIPGLAPVLKVHGREVPLAEATVADVEAYRDMYQQIHENYAKRLALIEAALEAMREGSDGDDTANAIKAWKRGTGDDEPEPEAVAA